MSTASDPPPLRLAATAIPVRDGTDGPEVLLLRRNEQLSFGGMWAFPGGSLEPVDGLPVNPLDESSAEWDEPTLVRAAAAAAVRETREETALEFEPDSLQWFSHWIPPRAGAPKRFATWFFISERFSGEIVLDERENDRWQWLSPADAVAASDDGELPLAPPTVVTLLDLTGFATAADAVKSGASGPRWHHTRAVPGTPLTLLWHGDAGYESLDVAASGPRNRATIDERGRLRRQC